MFLSESNKAEADAAPPEVLAAVTYGRLPDSIDRSARVA